MRLPYYFKEWLDAGDAHNPGPCECGAQWYRTNGGRIRIDHDLEKHKALAHPVDRPTEPTFAEQRATLPHEDDHLPYPDD